MTAFFDTVNQTNEQCPGAESCAATFGKPLNKYGKSQSEEKICGGCKLLPTKPDAIEPELVEHFRTAFELGNLKEAGAVFAYPDALSSLEWAYLTALQASKTEARIKHEAREARKQKSRKS